MKYRLFFAWQSQNRKAYSYIKNQLLEAIKSYLDYCDLHLEYEDQLQSITIVD